MSHFLVDASLPRAAAATIRGCGHQATDVRDIGLGTAPDQDIADYARQNQLALITADTDFGNVLAYPPADYAGLVIIRPPDGATARAAPATCGAPPVSSAWPATRCCAPNAS